MADANTVRDIGERQVAPHFRQLGFPITGAQQKIGTDATVIHAYSAHVLAVQFRVDCMSSLLRKMQVPARLSGSTHATCVRGSAPYSVGVVCNFRISFSP